MLVIDVGDCVDVPDICGLIMWVIFAQYNWDSFFAKRTKFLPDGNQNNNSETVATTFLVYSYYFSISSHTPRLSLLLTG